ncbi:class I SAM-dependent methyltransferase [Algoriphagus terrigena]|uniref:class I SAM-dependent methyltransferase n=1 Tax=Algoriphagus terrigena TaxID=344884 RepID=UPI0003FA815B|nr:class I SAM-dependent methyltransferase [Algoriphagus terrigena]
MSDAYGFLAPIYQPLSTLVFGGDLVAANSVFSALAAGKISLIIGGGDAVAYSDWDESFSGEYWDTSLKMTELAKHNLERSKVRVNCGSWPGVGKFDVILLPFVLDTLPGREIEKLIGQIADSLNPGGKVILSDFFSPKTFPQRVLQGLMITGFRVFAEHLRTDLPDFERFFEGKSWRLLEEQTWRKGWIRARVYGRMDDSAY